MQQGGREAQRRGTATFAGLPRRSRSRRILRDQSACGRSWNGNTWVPCVLQALLRDSSSRRLATRPQFSSGLHPRNSDSPGRGASAQGPAWCPADSPSDSRPTALPTQGALGAVLSARRLWRQDIGKPRLGPLAKSSAEVGAGSGKNTVSPTPRPLPAQDSASATAGGVMVGGRWGPPRDIITLKLTCTSGSKILPG